MDGFHEGELAVQRRAGVERQAARLEGMLAAPDLTGGVSAFLAGRGYASLAARDGDGRIWVSPLAGPPGFLRPASSTRLLVGAAPLPGDPLVGLAADQDAGLVVIEFAARRRLRINGRIVAARPGGLEIEVEQAYGNCPQFIHPRRLELRSGPPDDPAVRRPALAPEDRELVRAADTFVIGSAHPVRGADASHRGGPPGFLRADADGSLWWPDHPGNQMFTTLGNLDVDPAAALLVADWTTGRTVQVSGRAAVEWVRPGSPGDDGGTGRRVRLHPEAVVSGRLLPVRTAA